jgi:hypothetical protein
MATARVNGKGIHNSEDSTGGPGDQEKGISFAHS